MICGTGRRAINPEPGHHLAGYGPMYPNAGVHDDITVSAMFLSDGKAQAILLAYDLVGLLADFNARIRAAVSQASGVPANQVFLTCTHTHSGPECRDHNAQGEPNTTCRQDYLDRLVEWSAAAAKDAVESAEACTLLYNFTYASENMNRRFLFPDRLWMYIPDHKQLAGLSSEFVDRELGIVAFRKQGTRNQYKAILTNYAAHPLCVGNSSNLVSADYQGYIRRTVEETFAGSMCIATTGAAGDLHPLLPESGFQSAKAMGTSLGRLAIARTYDAVRVDYDECLRLAYEPIRLKVKDDATVSLLPEAADRQAPAQWAAQGKTHFDTFYNLLGIGPILLAGVPGELLAEAGAIIKWTSPFLKNYILFQGTDNLGYLALRNQYLWGGYEATSNPLAVGATDNVVQGIIDRAKQLVQTQPLNYPPRKA